MVPLKGSWKLLFIIGLVATEFVQGAAESEGPEVVVIVIGSKTKNTVQMVSDTRKDFQKQCGETKCTVIDAVNDNPRKEGTWTILSALLSSAHNSTNWYVIADERTKFRVGKLVKYLEAKNPDEKVFEGLGLIDKEPTIIHHFGFELPDGFRYPEVAAGVVISRSVVKLLAETTALKIPNFSIDAKHEFASLLFKKFGIQMTSNRNVFCLNEDGEGSDCVTYYQKPTYEKDGKFGPLRDEDIQVMIKTHSGNHKSRLPFIMNTWAQLAPSLEYCSDVTDESLMTIDMGVGNTERGHCSKTWAILKRFNESKTIQKWLLIADDDTLISWQRMKRMIEEYDGDENMIIGERYGYGFGLDGLNGYDYPTGGSGMIFTRNAVQKLLKTCPHCYSSEDPDDMMIGMCALRAGIPVVHNGAMHQARSNDYAEQYLSKESAISFHKFNEVDPYEVYRGYLHVDDVEGRMNGRTEL